MLYLQIERYIVELYSEGLISKEFVQELSAKSDISLKLTLIQINEHYITLKKQSEPNENDLNKLDKEIELFKLLNLDDKTDEELQEALIAIGELEAEIETNDIKITK